MKLFFAIPTRFVRSSTDLAIISSLYCNQRNEMPSANDNYIW